MAQLSIMIKPASSRCNLACDYCFYRDEAKNRAVADFGAMDNACFDELLAKAICYAQGDDISLTFQGGEPLLAGKEFFRHAFETIRGINNCGNISVSVQTNGTLIDKEWAQMFKLNNVLVGISIDGNKRCNSHRKTASGDNSFDGIIRGVNILKLHQVDFNAVIVATKLSARNIAEIYAFFKRNGMRYLQFIPCLATIDGDSRFAPTADEYGEMLCKLFDLYYDDLISGDYVSVRYFDNLVNLARLGHCEQCGLGGVCAKQYVAEANGNVYPCDFYCLDKYLLGNVNTQNFEDFEAVAIEFLEETALPKAECRSCPYIKLCRGGGCKRERQSTDYCWAYKIFFRQNFDKIINLGKLSK